MYSILFSGPVVSYITRRGSMWQVDKQIKRLKSMRVQLILILKWRQPKALYTHVGGGRYNLRRW